MSGPSVITRLQLDERPVLTAPDGSKIRELGRVRGASIAHCTLAAGLVTHPVRHRTVEEVWFVLSGEGELWQRNQEDREEIVELTAGTCVTIPLGNAFQFRAADREPLVMLLTTSPRWPDTDTEAMPVSGAWSPHL